MLSNKVKYLLLVAVAALTVACNNSKDQALLWGETKCYDDFLWVKQTPDTLKQTLCFDFNDDARRYMHEPLKLGVFKKGENNEFVQLKEDEVELFVDGQKVEGNVLTVPVSCQEMEVGVVLTKNAEVKTHYWYLRPIDTAGLERINDKAVSAASDDDAIMSIKLRKSHRMNPLAEGLLIFALIVLGTLILWFVVIKPIQFPSFGVNKLELIGPEPYLNTIKLRRYRKLVLTSKTTTQSWLSRVFTGEIKYSVNQIWTADVVFEPKDKRSIRIRPAKNEYLTDARIMKIDEEYTLENLTTKSKTIMKIS